ncbi:hypothetical protein ABB37_04273 [Leptomonas pyrrhocoris]|uniref:Uncharacterized protein n=1 Tax=Leptomonas pyrrhocoris TaxID=157538 RepID=A0A0N0VFL3_LEPPY|nr:hypothetical protein ABB37_04273 [Leptomonas pyrrhocoris]KPA80851.1 hypothetical protein ABB37_04273 [Leptomonas pyrrhocoris]|eukprot:XP_015659290.1 hypothetical protein ABB37_04273 [Leptomonas pyrrhocoris]
MGANSYHNVSNGARGASPPMVSRGGPPMPVGARGGGGAPPAAAMRGKMPVPSPSPPPGMKMQVKMPPGQMGKSTVMMRGGKMMMMPPPPDVHRTASPTTGARSLSPVGTDGGLSSGMPGTPSPGSRRASSAAAGPYPYPYPPQFAVVNGKKMMVPPGTKLPGPTPPGMQMAGKKMMMMMSGGPPGQQQQQQVNRSHLPTSPPLGPGAKQPPQLRIPNGAALIPPSTNTPPSRGGGLSPVRRGSMPGAGPPVSGSPPSPTPQQQQQGSLPLSRLSPPHPGQPPPPPLHASQQQQQQQQQQANKKHKSGFKSGLSGALSFFKLGSSSEDEEYEKNKAHGQHETANKQPQQQGQQPSHSPHPSGSSAPSSPGQRQPTPPHNEMMTAQGKRIMMPPGTKLPPGMQAPPLLPGPAAPTEQRGKSPAGALHSGPPSPPGAVKMVKMPVGAHPPPPPQHPQPQPQRSASVGSYTAETPPRSPSSSVPRAQSPIAQMPQKAVMKAPPGAVLMKKKMVMAAPPPSGGGTSPPQGSTGRQSPDRPPPSMMLSRSGSISVPLSMSAPPSQRQPLQPPQQQQQHPPFPPGAHLVKHMMGPPPPGAKLISSPPAGFHVPDTVPLLTSPSPPARLPTVLPPASSGVLRVPSTTVLKDGELPEAGVQTPPHPRRRRGESSDDSDDDDEGAKPIDTHRTVSRGRGRGSSRGSTSSGGAAYEETPPTEDVVPTGYAGQGDYDQQQQQQEERDVGGEHYRDPTRELEDDTAAEGGAAATPKKHTKSAGAVPSSRAAAASSAIHAQGKTPSAPLPPVRQTAVSAAAATRSAALAAKRKEDATKTKTAAEDHNKARKTTQSRRPTKLAEVRRAPKAAAEPASPQEEDTTQKPASLDRSSSSVVSTPSPSHSSSASSHASAQHPDSNVPNAARDENTGGEAKKKEERSSGSRGGGRRRSPSPRPQATKAKDAEEKNRSASRKGRARRSAFASEDDDSGSERLTSRELYRLVNALRGDKRKDEDGRNTRSVSARRRRGLRRRANNDDDDAAADNSDAEAGGGEEGDDWGLRSKRSSSCSSNSGSGSPHRPHRHRPSHALSATRQRQKDREEWAPRRRSSLPASTVGIPWRYTSAGRSSEPFATPPPVRRPLGYINVGGGRYARVGGSPYAIRPASATRRGNAASVGSIPLDISNTAHDRLHARPPGRSLLSDGLDPATSAIVDAHDNTVVNEVRASALARRGSPLSRTRGSAAAYYNQQAQPTRSIHLTSPLRFPSPVCQETVLDESVSTADSQHPYCVSASALLPSMRALTPVRRSPQRDNGHCDHQLFASPTSATASAAREPIVERSLEKQPATGNADRANARTSVAASPASTAIDATARSPLGALRRSAFFEQLHSGNVHRNGINHNRRADAPVTSSAAIVGGNGGGDNAGWEWARRRPATPTGSRLSSVSHNSAPPSSSQQQQQQQPAKTKAAGSDVGGSAVPRLIPTLSNSVSPITLDLPTSADADAAAAAAAPAALSRNLRASTPDVRHALPQQQQQQQRPSPSFKARANSVGAAVSAAAAAPRNCNSNNNNNTNFTPDRYRPPSRTREPLHLTRATIARLSTPQQRRGAATTAAMLHATAGHRSANGEVKNSNDSSTVRTCSKWLDEILGSTTVTPTGVVVREEGQDAAAAVAAAAGALPIVDLRSEFKPRVAEIEGSVPGRAGKRAAAAGAAMQDPDAHDHTRDFTGSRPRPHIPTISFKHMIGVRRQSPTTAAATESEAAAAAAHPNVVVRGVNGVREGLPFEKYSTLRLADPTRRSPWALAPEREGLDVLPGRPALSRRRRIPALNSNGGARPIDADEAERASSTAGGSGSPHRNDGDDSTQRTATAKASGATVVEEVYLDEHRRPYLVVRPVPNAEAAEAQRLAVARLSRPKPIYQRAD